MFFETNALKNVDAILGYKGMNDLHAKIDLEKLLFVTKGEIVENLKFEFA